MSRRLTFQGSEIKFPAVCLVCRLPADKLYDFTRTFSYGRQSATITIPAPLCDDHLAIAARKNRKERWIGKIGLVAGMVVGIGVMMGLLIYWKVTQQGWWLSNFFLSAFLGAGAFLIVWVTLASFVAPLFADPDSKAVRGALKIRHYWPGSQDVQLEFVNEAAADHVAADNAGRLLRRE